ncbi:ImmA/IrrE family metallo-endopeptidase [Streptomyces sp. NPDC050548]|uniref:ImmA/IrrE family metallo-endopeptidase n=1 Tax=Streptomyces sp. NPDC050548 TaxID=3365629 RepID=UPI0037947FA1
MPEANNPESIYFYFDIDGFVLGPADEIEPRHSIRSSKPSATEYSIAHYLLRSSITLGSDCTEEGWKSFQMFSLGCAKDARNLVDNWTKVANPLWIREFRENLKSSGRVEPSAIDAIGCSFVLTPKIQAYCFPAEQRIEISAVAPTHLRTVNLLLWSMATNLRRAFGPGGPFKQTESEADDSTSNVVDTEVWMAGENYVDLLLPYLFSLYFSNVNYSSLPIPRAPSKELFMRAKESARIQVNFMLAHEYAHLVFHQDKAPSPELEREADTFAYELLLDDEKFHNDSSGMFMASCRWFFLYLTLDRIIGAVLSGYDIDWIDVPIRDRETWLVKRVSDIEFSSAEERDCQFLGDLVLFQAKAKLRERGVDWIRSAAKEFEKKHCFSVQSHT